MAEVEIRKSVQIMCGGQFFPIPESLADKLVKEKMIRRVNQRWDVYVITKKAQKLIKSKYYVTS